MDKYKNPIVKFVNWYSDNLDKSQWVTLGILVSQIPHFIWGGDVLIGSGYVANVNPLLDFILYGVDLFEIPLIIKVFVDALVFRKKMNAVKEEKIKNV